MPSETIALLTCLSETVDQARPPATNFLMVLRFADFDKIALAEGLDLAISLGEELADQCRRQLQPKDRVLRLSERDLGLVFPNMPNRAMIGLVAHKLQHIVRHSVGSRLGKVPLRTHIGVVVYPDQGSEPAEILRHAFVAMLGAARHGSDLAEYSAETAQNFRHELDIEAELAGAVVRDELHLVFQPQVNLQSGRLTGAEALLRWFSPRLGAVSPGHFIPVAESNGAIILITEWVIQKALNVFQTFQGPGMPDLELGINVSPATLRDPGFPAFLENCLELWNFPPRHLMLEITEGAMIENPQEALRTLRELKKLGVGLSVDDFGTGYSSLQYLSRLPIDQIKIDQSFLRDVEAWERNEKIVRTIVSLAGHFDLDVVAEGIETEDVLEFLRGIGCRTGQGYRISRPLETEAFGTFLAGYDPNRCLKGPV